MTGRRILTVLAGAACSAIPCAAAGKVCATLHDRGGCEFGAVDDRYTLSDGNTIPVVAFGTAGHLIGQSGAYQAVRDALDAGYRNIDSAEMYRNHMEVGQAILDSNLPRSEVWVQSKSWVDLPVEGVFEEVLRRFERAMSKMGLTYLDAFMPHAPAKSLIEMWDAILYLQRRGLIRSAIVSNFNVAHLEALEAAGRPLPVANQIEVHPLNYEQFGMKQVVEWCHNRGILIQAYGSLLTGGRLEQPSLWESPVLTDIAAAHIGKTVPNVLLRWALQKGFQLLTMSKKKKRLEENKAVFDFTLSPDEMAALDGWRIENRLRIYWNSEYPLWDVEPHLGDVEKYRRGPVDDKVEL